MSMSFAAACRKFFGMKPGESLSEFAAELKSLTAEDRAELAPMLSDALGEEVKAQ